MNGLELLIRNEAALVVLEAVRISGMIIVAPLGFTQAPARVKETEPALARFDAVVFRRTSCADMARPAMSNTVIGRLALPIMAYSPLRARRIVEIRPSRKESVVRYCIAFSAKSVCSVLSSTVLPSIDGVSGTR